MEGRLRLLEPAEAQLPAYAEALARGWSPDTRREVSGEEFAAIAADPRGHLAVLRGQAGGTVRLPDGRDVPRLPGATRWMWDGAFCGAINLRHVPGSQELPAHVAGHVGYVVVPWKRGRGYATRALGLMLPVAAALGLRWLDATCAPTNEASRRVLLANGAVEIPRPQAAKGLRDDTLLFRIPLPPA